MKPAQMPAIGRHGWPSTPPAAALSRQMQPVSVAGDRTVRRHAHWRLALCAWPRTADDIVPHCDDCDIGTQKSGYMVSLQENPLVWSNKGSHRIGSQARFLPDGRRQ